MRLDEMHQVMRYIDYLKGQLRGLASAKAYADASKEVSDKIDKRMDYVEAELYEQYEKLKRLSGTHASLEKGE